MKLNSGLKQCPFVIVVLFLLPISLGSSQDDSMEQVQSKAASNLAAAKQLSAASGRPIFAIAGRST